MGAHGRHLGVERERLVEPEPGEGTWQGRLRQLRHGRAVRVGERFLPCAEHRAAGGNEEMVELSQSRILAQRSVKAADFALRTGFNKYDRIDFLPVMMSTSATMPGMIGRPPVSVVWSVATRTV